MRGDCRAGDRQDPPRDGGAGGREPAAPARRTDGPAGAARRPGAGVADVAVAAVSVTVVPCNGRTRLWALVLLAPVTWLAGRGLDVLAALLG